MNPYAFKLSLRVSHASIDPAKISDELQIAPSRAWRAGDAKTTPKGNQLPGHRKHSYWTAGLGEGSDALPDALDAALKRLAPHRAFFHQVRSEGGRAEFFIGWFFDRMSGDVFPWELLSRAADLKIDLSFDVYPEDACKGDDPSGSTDREPPD